MKEEFLKMRTLAFPSLDRPLILRTDPSSVAIGTSLSQEIEDQEYYIHFSSKKLNDAERNYSVIDKELLAIVWSFKKFRPYLLGRKFILYTDHNPLKYLSSFKDSHNRRSRWLMSLNEFDFEIRHINGKDNIIADYLSRSVNSIEISSNQDLEDAQRADPQIQKIIKALKNGNDLEDCKDEFIKNIWKVRENLVIMDHLLMYCDDKGQRLFPPKSLIETIIQEVHGRETCHSGKNETLQIIKNNLFCQV